MNHKGQNGASWNNEHSEIKNLILDCQDQEQFFHEELRQQHGFNPPLPEQQLLNFERKYQVALPSDFRSFLTTLGDGGFIPRGGILPLDGIEKNIQDPQLLRQDFPLEKGWYIEKAPNQRILNVAEVPGTIAFSNDANIKKLLVLNGKMKGTVLMDDRKNPGDFGPSVHPIHGETARFAQKKWLRFSEFLIDQLTAFYQRRQTKIKVTQDLINGLNEKVETIRLENYAPLTSLEFLPRNLPLLTHCRLSYLMIKNLAGMPLVLPDLEELCLQSLKLSSLQGFPQSTENLKILSIIDVTLGNFTGIPPKLPNLKRLSLSGSRIGSFADFPKEIPNLRELNLGWCITKQEDLNFLPPSLPNLQYLTLSKSTITSLKGLPGNVPSSLKIIK